MVYGSIALMLVYVAWIAGPYLRSIIVRDAAVTSWVNPVAAPIDGHVGANILHAGERVGDDGRFAIIAKPDADETALALARSELEGDSGRQATLEARVEKLQREVALNRARSETFAMAFRQDLDARIRNAEAAIELVRSRLDSERADTDRTIEDERTLMELERTAESARMRRAAADNGVFLLENGGESGHSVRDLEASEAALVQAMADLEAVTREVMAGRAVVAAAIRAYQQALSTPVDLPPNAMIWSLISAPGAAVQAGAPLATWIDCSVMLVDVPVSDVELALLRPCGEAHVILEGRSRQRTGTILLIRGGASTLGSDDLAAVAKGRSPGVGQVLVTLEPSLDDIEACPIGLAAHVDFPGVGFIDVMRARLRL